MNRHEKPADPVGTGGLSSVMSRGSRHQNVTPVAPFSQVDWAMARELERRSIVSARDALILRGAERFNALALASTYAVAARDLALNGRGAR